MIDLRPGERMALFVKPDGSRFLGVLGAEDYGKLVAAAGASPQKASAAGSRIGRSVVLDLPEPPAPPSS